MQYFNAALALAAVVSGAAVSLPPVLYNVTGFSAYCLDFTNTCLYVLLDPAPSLLLYSPLGVSGPLLLTIHTLATTSLSTPWGP